jgi:hypothetical protein
MIVPLIDPDDLRSPKTLRASIFDSKGQKACTIFAGWPDELRPDLPKEARQAWLP